MSKPYRTYIALLGASIQTLASWMDFYAPNQDIQQANDDTTALLTPYNYSQTTFDNVAEAYSNKWLLQALLVVPFLWFLWLSKHELEHIQETDDIDPELLSHQGLNSFKLFIGHTSITLTTVSMFISVYSTLTGSLPLSQMSQYDWHDIEFSSMACGLALLSSYNSYRMSQFIWAIMKKGVFAAKIFEHDTPADSKVFDSTQKMNVCFVGLTIGFACTTGAAELLITSRFNSIDLTIFYINH